MFDSGKGINALTFSGNRSSVLVLTETEGQQYFQLFDQTRITESVIQKFPVTNISFMSGTFALSILGERTKNEIYILKYLQ